MPLCFGFYQTQTQVAVGTCGSANLQTGLEPDLAVVFIDEAGQVSESESLLCVSKIAKDDRLTLCGDQMQLPPYSRESRCKDQMR